MMAADDRALSLIQRQSGVMMVFQRSLRAVGKLLVQHQAANVVEQSRDEVPLGVAFPAKAGNRTRRKPAGQAMPP